MVDLNAHEFYHDSNKEDIKAIKECQDGVTNSRGVEVEARKIGKTVRKEIQEKRQ